MGSAVLWPHRNKISGSFFNHQPNTRLFSKGYLLNRLSSQNLHMEAKFSMHKI